MSPGSFVIQNLDRQLELSHTHPIRKEPILPIVILTLTPIKGFWTRIEAILISKLNNEHLDRKNRRVRVFTESEARLPECYRVVRAELLHIREGGGD